MLRNSKIVRTISYIKLVILESAWLVLQSEFLKCKRNNIDSKFFFIFLIFFNYLPLATADVYIGFI